LILTVLFLQIVSNLTLLAQQQLHPPILWIQLDNPTGENKHKYLLAFCSWLIHLGWFKEIVISFLPPGHTHIDIDQMFSTFAIWLLRHAVFFITSFISALVTAYKTPSTRPSGSFLQHVYNWKGFFAPHMCDIQGLTTTHAILLRELPNKTVGIKFKSWHSSPTLWKGDSHYPSEWLNIMSSYPSSHPPVIQPSLLETEVTLSYVENLLPTDIDPAILHKWKVFFCDSILRTQYYEQEPDDLWHFSRVYFILTYSVAAHF
jgi:hypothetical protein